MPLRLVCTCSDATVRLLSPGSGECITTMLLPSMSIIADVAYAAAESMFPVILFKRHDYHKIVIRELKHQRFGATDVNRKWTFCSIGLWFG